MNVKKFIPELIIFSVFVICASIYFWTALKGNVIYSVDSLNYKYSSHASVEYTERTGEGTYWTEALFSGMPNYHTGGKPRYWIDKLMFPVKFVIGQCGKNAFAIFLCYLCAFFLLLRTFKIDKWISMAGAFAIAFSTYFFVIIAASHANKCFTITWMTIVIIGFLLIFRKEYGWGCILTMLFTYIGFFLHPQMSYYICMMLGIFVLTELYIHVVEKRWKDFFIAVGVFIGSFGVGLGMGASNVFTNIEYAEQTMRGGHSDLKKATDEQNKTQGLDLDYATAWSYGIDETMTLLIPNFMGGASGYTLNKDSRLYNDLVGKGVSAKMAKDFCMSAPTYRGEKAFTSGPVYVGAIIVFLFILGLLLVQSPYKWGLLLCTLFSILLSWGRHLMPLTKFFYDYFPVYNKFRAVESILIVAEIAIPILAFLVIQHIIESKNDPTQRNKIKKAIYLSTGLTSAVCLFFAFWGSAVCNFTSSYDNHIIQQIGKDIYQLVLDQRAAMLTGDAWRSLIFIFLGSIVLLLYVNQRISEKILGILLTILIIADMWPVNKRFCNDKSFSSPKRIEKDVKMLPYEKEILDNDKSVFRVLNLTANTFNDSRTSYYFNSVGGYSAAKLRRYQDLIDEHISQMNVNVLNMLNTKYIITRSQNGSPRPHLNEKAYGNCWFVDSLCFVNTPNSESDTLRTLNLKHIAVFDTTYPVNKKLTSFPIRKNYSENDIIQLSYFGQNRLEYTTQASQDRIAVLSEIYYPYGWHATIDDQPTDIFRTNYTLRAIIIPAGEHVIKLWFYPESIKKGNWVSLFFFFVMLITSAVILIHKAKNKNIINKYNNLPSVLEHEKK